MSYQRIVGVTDQRVKTLLQRTRAVFKFRAPRALTEVIQAGKGRRHDEHDGADVILKHNLRLRRGRWRLCVTTSLATHSIDRQDGS